MKTLFTKYLFIVFSLPILMIMINSYYIKKETTGTIGFNRTISWGFWDKYLGDPLYNFVVFSITYLVYLLGYFIILLIRRTTSYKLSLAHFILFIISFILIDFSKEYYILIPLSIIGFIIFIFNIFKTTKKPSTINQQQSTK